MKALPFTSRWLTAFLGLALVATPLAAQTLHQHDPVPNEDILKADKLFAEAQALMAQCDRSKWSKAADLFLESAELRPCHDPKIFAGMREAAQIHYYLGHLDESLKTMKRAAAHAMLVGDVANAAGAYLDAAVLAAESGDRYLSEAYLARSEDLSSSKLLDPAQKAALKTRLNMVFNGGG